MVTAASIMNSSFRLFGQDGAKVGALVDVFHCTSIFRSRERILPPDQAVQVIAAAKRQFGAEGAFKVFQQLKGAFYRPYQWRRWCQKSFFPREQIQLLAIIASWKKFEMAKTALKELGFYNQSKAGARVAYEIEKELFDLIEIPDSLKWLSEPIAIFQREFGEEGRLFAEKESRKHYLMKNRGSEAEMVALLPQQKEEVDEVDEKENEVVIILPPEDGVPENQELPNVSEILIRALPLLSQCRQLSQLIQIFHSSKKPLSPEVALAAFRGIAKSRRFSHQDLYATFQQLKTAWIVKKWLEKTVFYPEELVEAIQIFAGTTRELNLSSKILNQTGFYDLRDGENRRSYHFRAANGDYEPGDLSGKLLAQPICIFADVFGLPGAEAAIKKGKDHHRIGDAVEAVTAHFQWEREVPLFDDQTVERLTDSMDHSIWRPSNLCHAILDDDPEDGGGSGGGFGYHGAFGLPRSF